MRTPKSNRPHIGIFGRRNAGKSSLINALTGQPLAIVSDMPGTTTDPVEKAMELLPFGPVVLIDTAGLDDEGELGRLRTDRSRAALDRADLALVVAVGRLADCDRELLRQLREQGVPAILVWNQIDRVAPDDEPPVQVPVAQVSCRTGAGIDALKQQLIDNLKDWQDRMNPSLTADLVRPGGCAVLVTPIDREAPAGRLILPQVQTIRDILDHDAWCVVVKERELYHALRSLAVRPDIVITDSQAFLKVAADVPDDVPMTSFSILFARQKGDLALLAAGARAIDHLNDDDVVLIAEACTHHTEGDDIGSVKIPRLLRQYTGKRLRFEFARGKHFQMPRKPALMIHCGGCMLNRRAMGSRLREAAGAGIPVTNYGMALAVTTGMFERAMRPFNLPMGP